MDKYIVKEIHSDVYYIGYPIGWDSNPKGAQIFNTEEDAKKFIKGFSELNCHGYYEIKKIYISKID